MHQGILIILVLEALLEYCLIVLGSMLCLEHSVFTSFHVGLSPINLD